MFAGEDDYVPYTKYKLEIDLMLKEYARSYDHTGPAHGHHNEVAAAMSRRITQYVRLNWKSEFEKNQYPFIQRRGFTKYVQGNN
jgi:hypothetical protein